MSSRGHSRSRSNAADHDPNDPSTYGISTTGEPLDQMTPLGKRIAMFPQKRAIDFRLDKEGRPVFKDIRENSRNSASWAQTRGSRVLKACDYCTAGNGPFASCVVLRDENRQLFFEGTCANCQFGRRGPKCSLRGPLAVPADNLLGKFQAPPPSSEAQVQRELQTLPDTKVRKALGEDPFANKKRRLDESRSTSTPESVPRRASSGGEDVGRGRTGTRQPNFDPRPSGPAQANSTGSLSSHFSAPEIGPQNQHQNQHHTNRPTLSTITRQASYANSHEAHVPSQLNSATNARPDSPLFVSPASQEDQGRPRASSGSANQFKVPGERAQLETNKSKAAVVPLPLSTAMFHDAGLLRQAVADLEGYLLVAKDRLKKLESPPQSAADVWGTAMADLERLAEG